MEKKLIIFSKLFGKSLNQNKHNNKFVKIKPNVKLIKQRKKNHSIKLRYHQTNAGGDIHSDGPQLATPPKYVIMGCIQQAKKGGFSIVASSKKIAEYLKIKNPKNYSILLLSAGIGRRLGKLGINTPKCLLKINEKRIIEYLIEHLQKRKVKEISIVVGYKSKMIIDALKRFKKIKFNFIKINNYKKNGHAVSWHAYKDMWEKKIQHYYFIQIYFLTQLT